MKTFECPGYYSWLTNYISNDSHYGEKNEEPAYFAKSPKLHIYLQYFFRAEMEEARRASFNILRNIKTHIH